MEAVEQDVGEQHSHAQASAVRGLVGHGHQACCLGFLLGCHQLWGGDECAGVEIAAGHPSHNNVPCAQTSEPSAFCAVVVSQISSDMHHPKEKRMSLVLREATARCPTGNIFWRVSNVAD